jgi:hypothetical protein
VSDKNGTHEPAWYEWKRKAAKHWYEATKDLTPEEERAYYERVNKEFLEGIEKRRLEAERAKDAKGAPVPSR